MHYLIPLLCSVLLTGGCTDAPEALQDSLAEGRTLDDAMIIEDFDGYQPGDIPTGWKYLSGRSLEPVTEEFMRDDEYFVIKRENERQFARAYTKGEVVRIILPNKKGGYTWDITEYPRLRWDWRVLEAAENAREDRDEFNDTPAAVYVTFSVNFFGIPRSIKYTYSSTLPVGTVVSFRGLKVLVVASGRNGFGEWVGVERNVAADYRELFGGSPPAEPLSIALWSDSDTIGGTSRADFDTLKLLPAE